MSIATMNWALRQRLGSPHHQCLLYVIADSADPEGVTRHCVPDYLVRHARMARATVFRKLADLRELGLLETFSSHGERGEHIYEIRLNLDKLVDVPIKSRAESQSETADAADAEISPESQSETHAVHDGDSGSLTGETGAVSQGRPAQSHCGDRICPPISKDSPPNPPPGGLEVNSVGEPEHFAEFRRDYPLTSQWSWQKVLPVFALLKPAEAAHARAAAPLYAHQCDQPKAPRPKRPDSWLRERMFENFPDAKISGSPIVQSTMKQIDPQSPEGRAVLTIYAVARAVKPYIGREGKMLWRGELSPQLLAMATAPPRDRWVRISERNQIGAWAGIVKQYVTTPRPPLLVTDERGEYLLAPWRWPPRKDGTLSSDGDETLMTDEDAAVLAQEGLR